MESIEQKAIELIEKFESLATELAPDALELGLAAARVAAAAHLVNGMVLGGAALAAILAVKWVWRVSQELERVDREMIRGIGGVIGAVAGVGCAMVAIGFLTNVWAWVGIFYPELWIAKQVLGW